MKRFIECLVPDTFCNFRCSYCYVSQNNWRTNERLQPLYDAEYIARALSPERLGGTSYINLAGRGETLTLKSVVDIVHAILKTGHYVNITTNGTLDKRFDQLLDFDAELLKHLNISFSFHVVELKKHNMMERFFRNIKKVREAGCSFVLQINLVDEYLPYWEEVKELSLKHVGALPQVALTREEDLSKPVPVFNIMTKGSEEEYAKKAREMNSPLFECTLTNFNRRQDRFCYAGCWSATLNLFTGDMTSCYAQGYTQNIYADLSKPIKFEPIGICKNVYCVNSSHFLSLGCIPSYKIPSYAALRNRADAHWYSNEMLKFLSVKLEEENKRLPYERLYTLMIPLLRIKLIAKWQWKIKKHFMKRRMRRERKNQIS